MVSIDPAHWAVGVGAGLVGCNGRRVIDLFRARGVDEGASRGALAAAESDAADGVVGGAVDDDVNGVVDGAESGLKGEVRHRVDGGCDGATTRTN